MEGEFAIVTSADGYGGLVTAFRKRRDQLGLSNKTTDELAKIADGLTGKLLARNYAKMFGPVTLGGIMQTLALKIVLVEDADALAWLRRQVDYERRDEKRVRRRKQADGSKHSKRWLISPKTSAQMNVLRSFKTDAETRLEIARSGAKARAKKLPKATRRRIARKAAADRWKRRPRTTAVIKASPATADRLRALSRI